MLKFKQITSQVKDSHSYHSSSILSLAIIWGLTFLCNGACLCYEWACMCAHTCMIYSLIHLPVTPKLHLLRIWTTLLPTHLPGQNGGGSRGFSPALCSATAPSATSRLLLTWEIGQSPNADLAVLPTESSLKQKLLAFEFSQLKWCLTHNRHSVNTRVNDSSSFLLSVQHVSPEPSCRELSGLEVALAVSLHPMFLYPPHTSTNLS